MPMTTVTNGTLPDADKVMANFDYILGLDAQNLIDGTTTVTGKKVIFDTIQPADVHSSTNWTYDELATDLWYGDILVDQCNNSSINTSLWTATSWAENTSSMYASVGNSGDLIAYLNGVSAPDFKTFSGDTKILIQMQHQTDGGTGSSKNAAIRIGTTVIKNYQNTPSANYTYVLWINKAAQTASLYIKDGATVASGINIAGEANWYVNFRLNNTGTGGSSSTMGIYAISYITEGSATAPILVTDDDTMTTTTSWMYSYCKFNATTYLTSIQVSANSGTNYVTTGQGVSKNITNTGTAARIKITSSIPATLTDNNTYEAITVSKYVLFYDG